jgi:hypothetical protein
MFSSGAGARGARSAALTGEMLGKAAGQTNAPRIPDPIISHPGRIINLKFEIFEIY